MVTRKIDDISKTIFSKNDTKKTTLPYQFKSGIGYAVLSDLVAMPVNEIGVQYTIQFVFCHAYMVLDIFCNARFVKEC